MAFYKVTTLNDLWHGETQQVFVDHEDVLLIRIHERVYAYENRCVHQSVALSKGRLRGTTLICSAHEWEYDATTGCGLNPTDIQLKTFATKIENGDVWVDVEQVLAPRKAPCHGRRTI